MIVVKEVVNLKHTFIEKNYFIFTMSNFNPKKVSKPANIFGHKLSLKVLLAFSMLSISFLVSRMLSI